MNNLADEALVQKIQEGHAIAFEVLVKRYQKRLFGFVYRIVGNIEDTQEVVQDAFFNIYRSIDRVDTKRKFYTYLFAIAKNGAITKLRQKRHKVRLDTVEDVLSIDDEADNDIDLEADHERLHHAVASLDAKYGDIVRLYYFEELSYEEIGKRLKLPIGTVRTHLFRAKQELRKVLSYEKK